MFVCFSLAKDDEYSIKTKYNTDSKKVKRKRKSDDSDFKEKKVKA